MDSIEKLYKFRNVENASQQLNNYLKAIEEANARIKKQKLVISDLGTKPLCGILGLRRIYISHSSRKTRNSFFFNLSFICVESTLDGLTKENEKRNDLQTLINLKNGSHEQTTNELLEMYSFLEYINSFWHKKGNDDGTCSPSVSLRYMVLGTEFEGGLFFFVFSEANPAQVPKVQTL